MTSDKRKGKAATAAVLSDRVHTMESDTYCINWYVASIGIMTEQLSCSTIFNSWRRYEIVRNPYEINEKHMIVRTY